jgi:hypothetical protein
LKEGHNPTVEDTIQMLTDSSSVVISACSLAHLNLPIEKWSDLSNKQEYNIAELIKVWGPEELS